MPDEDKPAPDAKKPAFTFESEADFLSAAGKRFDGKVSKAQREAREAATREILDALGIDDPSKIAEIRDRLSQADTSLSELDRVKAESGTTARALKKAQEQVASLLGFKGDVLKSRAIDPILAKIHPDHRDVVKELLLIRARVLDDDKVFFGKDTDAKDPSAYIEDFIKEKPIYKAPDYKPGAGTKGTGGKSDTKGEEKPIVKEAPKDVQSAVRQSLQAQADEARRGNGGGGP